MHSSILTLQWVAVCFWAAYFLSRFLFIRFYRFYRNDKIVSQHHLCSANCQQGNVSIELFWQFCCSVRRKKRGRRERFGIIDGYWPPEMVYLGYLSIHISVSLCFSSFMLCKNKTMIKKNKHLTVKILPKFFIFLLCPPLFCGHVCIYVQYM